MNDEKHLRNLRGAMTVGYLLILRIAECLPSPVLIPRLDRGGWTPGEAVIQVERLREALLAEQPLEAEAAQMIEDLVLDWLTLGDVAAMAHMDGVTPYRVRAGERLADAIITRSDQIAERLGLDRF